MGALKRGLLFVVILSFSLVAFNHAEGQGLTNQKKVCDMIDKNGGNTLRGEVGGEKKTFWFTHFANYKKGNNVSTIMHALRNNHPANGPVLPVEWLAANLPYSPDQVGCRARVRETGLPIKEVDSEILYGPGKQHKVKASAYQAKQGQVNGVKLNSRIYSDNPKKPVDFRFSSVVHDGIYSYEAWSVGEAGQDLSFIIPDLAKYLDEFARKHKITVKEEMKPWFEHFTKKPLPAPINEWRPLLEQYSKKNTLNLAIGKGQQFKIEEREFRVDIYRPSTTELLESGEVSVYIPVLKAKGEK